MTSFCVDCKHMSLNLPVDTEHRCALCVDGVTGKPTICAYARGALNPRHSMISDDGGYREPRCQRFESALKPAGDDDGKAPVTGFTERVAELETKVERLRELIQNHKDETLGKCGDGIADPAIYITSAKNRRLWAVLLESNDDRD